MLQSNGEEIVSDDISFAGYQRMSGYAQHLLVAGFSKKTYVTQTTSNLRENFRDSSQNDCLRGVHPNCSSGIRR